MHSENPFSEDYDFDRLVEAHKPLAEFVFVNQYGNKTIKFSVPPAVNALNTALLKAHYNIIWEIPADNLCPAVPGRLDYLLHVADLIAKPTVRLLDIGTGANLIYPILATRHFNWHCTASEVDRNSIKHAQVIIDKNDSLGDIDLRLQPSRKQILKDIIQADDAFDVVVCNPPFFKNSIAAQKQNQRKVKNLQLQEPESKNFGGLGNELWCKGGEVAFVTQMALESVQFKDQVHWFTSLISNKENVRSIKRAIGKIDPAEIRIIELQQGNKNSRFVAWRF